MIIVAVISITAMVVGIVGCVVIWGLDASRAHEVERRAADSPSPRAIPLEPGPTEPLTTPAVRAVASPLRHH